jgi:hypothetical protein
LASNSKYCVLYNNDFFCPLTLAGARKHHPTLNI